jgi:hypothetical protein
MAKAVDDVELIGTTFFDGKMDDGTPHLVWICNFYRIHLKNY